MHILSQSIMFNGMKQISYFLGNETNKYIFINVSKYL